MSVRILFQLVVSDLRERTRRSSFLATLGLTIFAIYIYLPPADSGYAAFSLAGRRGIYDSAWIGSVAAICAIFLVFPVGFFLVKNSLQRDDRTGVGQILASTPLTGRQYLYSKAVSNLVFLYLLALALTGVAVLMQFVRGESYRLEVWHYLAPLLLATFPGLILVSCLAILFESIHSLKGGWGNFLYLGLWSLMATLSLLPIVAGIRDPWILQFLDPMGVGVIVADMLRQFLMEVPEAADQVRLGFSLVPSPAETFFFSGISWSWSTLMSRAVWLLVAYGILGWAASVFRRFDPSYESPADLKASPAALPEPQAGLAATSWTPRSLSQLESVPASRFSRLLRFYSAELRLLLKGQAWWWHAGLFVLIISQVATPLWFSRSYLLPAAWIWPLTLWSSMGCREATFRTQQILFSSPRPLGRQLPAAWLAGASVTLLAGGGVAVRSLLEQQWLSLALLSAAVLFIPALALSLGAWTSGEKAFEVLYTVLWYLGPVNGMAGLNFTSGAGLESALALTLAFALGLIAIAGRRRQLGQAWECD